MDFFYSHGVLANLDLHVLIQISRYNTELRNLVHERTILIIFYRNAVRAASDKGRDNLLAEKPPGKTLPKVGCPDEVQQTQSRYLKRKRNLATVYFRGIIRPNSI